MSGSSYNNCDLQKFVGNVVEIIPRYKAIVEFELHNNLARALLRYDKLKVNGQGLPEGGSIDQYVKKDTYVKFLCHPFDNTGKDRCSWYITCAWQIDQRELDLDRNDRVVSGLYNYTGYVCELARRQGVMSFSLKGKEETVMFLGSKLYIFGKRVPAKTSLHQVPGLADGQALMFDAVPSHPTDGSRCNWFATIVWKGRKPIMDYDKVEHTAKTIIVSPANQIKEAISNPHSMFLQTYGTVLKIVDPEFGIALAAIKVNHWESVLFHRSQVSLFGRNLAKDDLSKVFEKNDKIYIIAASSPSGALGVKWVASHVRVYMGGK